MKKTGTVDMQEKAHSRTESQIKLKGENNGTKEKRPVSQPLIKIKPINESLTAKHSTTGLPRPLQVSLGFLPKNMDHDGLSVVQTLETHERLDEERLGEFHVAVEEAHHGDTDVDRAELEKEGR